MGDKEIERHSKKNIVFGTVLGYISLGLNVVAGLVFTPWIIQSVGQSQYGVYTLTNSLVTLFLVDFGLSATANTFLSKYRSEGNLEAIKNTLGIIYKLYLFIDFVILLVFVGAFFLAPYIYGGLTFEEISQFQIAFVIVGVYSLISFPATTMNGVLTAYESFIALRLLNIIQRLLFIVFTSVCILLNWGLFALITANVLAGALCVLAKYIFIRAKIKVQSNLKVKLSREVVKPILAFSMWAAIQSIVNRVQFSLSPSILGVVSNSIQISIFGVESTVEGYIYSFGSIMSGFFLAKIARLKTEDPLNFEKNLLNLSVKVGKIQFCLVSLIIAGFVSAGRDFVFLWMRGDPTYEPAHIGIILLVTFQFFYVPQLVLHNAMYINKGVKYLALAELISAAINVPLSFALGYFYGAMGICIAIAFSRMITLVLYHFAYKKVLRIDMKSFYIRTYVRGSITFSLTITTGLLIANLAPISSTILRFLTTGFSVTLVFLVLTWTITLNKQERLGLLERMRKTPKTEER